MTTTRYFWFDVTMKEEHMTKDDIQSWCTKHCKKWMCQKEVGSKTGYRHWQLRMQLLERMYKKSVERVFGLGVSITSAGGKDNFDYVTKDATREGEPFGSEEITWPQQVLPLLNTENWYPWQKSVFKHLETYDPRKIDYIYDAGGNHGKSSFFQYLTIKGVINRIPWCDGDTKFVPRLAFNMTGNNFWLDIPRAVQGTARTVWSHIESLKDGWAWDDRFQWRSRVIPDVAIWITGNRWPPFAYLSCDRWRVWVIRDMALHLIRETELWALQAQSARGDGEVGASAVTILTSPSPPSDTPKRCPRRLILTEHD